MKHHVSVTLLAGMVLVLGTNLAWPQFTQGQGEPNPFEGADAEIVSGFVMPELNSVALSGTFIGNDDVHIAAQLQQPEMFSSDDFEAQNLLAEKFRPILYFTEDEDYRPQEIQVALDTADLYEDDVFEKSAPLTIEDLASRPEDNWKLDFLGDIFIENSPFTGEPYENTAYAHIVEDEGHIVLQYWFFYYFNDWEGAPLNLDLNHEGDWEFVYLIFEKDKSVAQIIDQNLQPIDAVYSAHFGGYLKSWDTLERDNNKPLVYVGRGSHANHPQKGVCDLVPQIGVGVDESWDDIVISLFEQEVIIDEKVGGLPLASTDYRWLLFGGKWGEHNFPGEDGPDTPANLVGRWSSPVSWAEENAIGWDEFYYERCDGDGDGVWNNVDEAPALFSDNFSAPGLFGTLTEGTIVERGDREFKIKDAEIGGAHFDVSPGSETAIILLNGLFCIPESTIDIKPNENRTFGTATCLSSGINIEDGGAEFSTVYNGVEVVATVSASQTVRFEIVEDQLQVETGGEGEIPLIINAQPTILQAGQISSVIEVHIDIKPSSNPNSVNCSNDNALISVAVLTTEDFDATTIDHNTVSFEGANEAHIDKKTGEPRRHEEDLDGDGDIDLVFHFYLADTDLVCSSFNATLLGETFDGDFFIGVDSINMIN